MGAARDSLDRTVALDSDDSPTARRTTGRALPWRALVVLALAVLALLAAAIAWRAWQARGDEAEADLQRQVEGLSERLNALRAEQRAQSRRLQQAVSLNRVLRDELDGIGQRAALLEASVSRLADPDRHGAQALRLDEAEMLLASGEQRLRVAGDLDGARRAYALAAGVLEGIDDPAWLSLRQTLLQERAGLDALGADPRVRAIAALDAFAIALVEPASREDAVRDARTPWWQRAFGRLLQVQPTDRAVAVDAADRNAALAGLQLELALARVAAERRDAPNFRSALRRADDWLLRLEPDSTARRQHRARLQALRAMPLSLSLPTLGSTLQQLRQQRAR